MNKQTKVLNEYARWKYVVLIASILLMLLSAIPSLYGEDGAIQFNKKARNEISLLETQQMLKQAKIEVKRIDDNDNSRVLVLRKQSQQTEAKNIFSNKVKDPESITLALSPAAPNWLLNLGFTPLKLGLDLRGGVQFLLDVDIDIVYHNQGIQLMDDLRKHFRSENIRSVTIQQGEAEILNVQSDSNKGLTAVRQFVSTSYPTWQVASSEQGVRLFIKANQKDVLRNMTVQQNLQIMRTRIEELGITEALVQRQGEHRIRIELPGVQDPASAKKVIGATASLAFYEVKDAGSVNAQVINDQHGKPVYVARRPVLTGDHIVDARSATSKLGQAKVNIALDSQGGSLMSHFSRKHIGKPMATAYSEYSRGENGKAKKNTHIISVATIQSQLGSRFEITGAGTHEKAQQLALLLRAGSMTAPVTIVEERTIGPSLGAENITNGVKALGLGMGITLLFMALWYRRLGWVANIALICNMIILFGLIALIPGAVLTLPGIAGLVLTVGMAVDTNVLIFERIRDKLKEGRSLAAAIDTGFDSAFSTIFDANFTTMITAVVLYSIGNGPIQGFALTLGLGLITSMYTGIFASRAIINLVYGRNTSREVRV
ncbi:protein translocase subunit SecD [Parashewanella spongiae]|uniref:Protein translocase subunit SecD n=1 Tax=Parashewanella spongiae TaxID=342950 RepID=A0A3A6TQN3_9GAMM|nr:protein translocase subunit SecD [Parashewanella spongiae]MCL1078366.1 protein translocase subunit SecD [Parashewanella spongiae]RJY10585.1 protein translocase subunit SecD [Parashewanella spongiae]